MGILDYNLKDVPELELLAPDEYQLEVIGADSSKLDKNDNPGLKLLFKSDKTNTGVIGHWIGLPGENDDEDTKNSKLRRLIPFINAFSIVKHEEDEDLIGSRGYCLIAVKEDPDYGQQNRITRFVEQR